MLAHTKNFPTKALAEEALSSHERAVRKHGESVLDFAPGELGRWIEARERLDDVGATIDEAVAFFLRHSSAARGREVIPVVTLIERCLEAKWEENKRPRYLSQLKCSASSFARWRDQGERPAHEISQRDVETWLKSQDWAPKTRNVYLTDLRTIFAWGVAQGHVGLNPCEGVARATLEDGEIASLTVTQCRTLLETCREGWPELLGYVTLGLFAGIRTEELARMTWDAVDAEAGTVVVSGARSKTRRRRVVDLEPNARAWLAFAKRTAPKVVPPNFTRAVEGSPESGGASG